MTTTAPLETRPAIAATQPKNLVFGIDATNRCHMLWHADPADVGRRFVHDVQTLVSTWRPRRMVCCFDAAPAEWRRELIPEYKAGPEKHDGIDQALADAKNECEDAGLWTLSEDGWEADDLLASLAAAAVRNGDRCVIVSPDKDLRQCLRPTQVTILNLRPYSSVGQPQWVTARDHEGQWGFPIARWTDFQAMVGDSSDNIRGWEGVGKKTAATWLAKHTLDEILGNPWLVKLNSRQERSLPDFRQRVAAVRQVVTLRTDSPLVEEVL